jgi:hypothetical protein
MRVTLLDVRVGGDIVEGVSIRGANPGSSNPSSSDSLITLDEWLPCVA